MGEVEAIRNAQVIAAQCAEQLQQGLTHILLCIPKTDAQLKRLGNRIKLVPQGRAPIGNYVSFNKGNAIAYFKAIDVLAFLAANFPDHIKVEAMPDG
jgi:hypothetical protein